MVFKKREKKKVITLLKNDDVKYGVKFYRADLSENDLALYYSSEEFRNKSNQINKKVIKLKLKKKFSGREKSNSIINKRNANEEESLIKYKYSGTKSSFVRNEIDI